MNNGLKKSLKMLLNQQLMVIELHIIHARYRFKEHLENTSFIVINAREKRVRINTSDIIYIEADGHYLKIITLDGEYKFKEKIKEFKTQLNNNNIIQVHRSYLINLDFVYDVNSKFIILRNKKEINIGKTYKKKFKLTYQDYLLNGSL